MLSLGDVIDNDLLYSITCIENTFSHMNYDKYLPLANNLEFQSHWISELNFEIKELDKTFRNNYYKYSFEYHHYERKRNVLKK